MSKQSHTAVSEVALRDDGKISLKVHVYGFEAGTPIEISGHAAQTGGAIATFYDVQTMPDNGDSDAGSDLTVIAVPSAKFQTGEAITVVTRAAEVWVTWLAQDPPGDIKAVWKTVKFRSALSPMGQA